MNNTLRDNLIYVVLKLYSKLKLLHFLLGYIEIVQLIEFFFKIILLLEFYFVKIFIIKSNLKIKLKKVISLYLLCRLI